MTSLSRSNLWTFSIVQALWIVVMLGCESEQSSREPSAPTLMDSKASPNLRRFAPPHAPMNTCKQRFVHDGTPCVLRHGRGICEHGTCELDRCTPGFGNCNNDDSDGCETLLITAENCGTCGAACEPGLNAKAACFAGKCALRCSPGYADCDGISSNGCETNVSTDALNCGSCGHACGPHEACTSGACSVLVCPAHYADCDGDTANGCEANLDDDTNHCGVCDAVCSPTSATGHCNAGSCVVAACYAGYWDCNGVTEDGCETRLSSDRNNCGACNNVCPSGECTDGICSTESYLSDPNNCGFQGNQCPACNQCVNGTCVSVPPGPEFSSDPKNCGCAGNQCPESYACSAGTCVNDPQYCSATGIRCPDSALCINGSFCVCGPHFQWPPCNGVCIDLDTDLNNCGVCGSACPPGMTCSLGKCMCPGPTCRLDGACCLPPDQCMVGTCVHNPLATDPQNCGSAGHRCATGEKCIFGECTCPGTRCDIDGVCCVSPQHCTHGICSNSPSDPYDSDPHNCGSAGHECGDCNICVDGNCTLDPIYLTDSNNCGCTGPCNSCNICIDGLCKLNPDFASDPSNCGCAGSQCPSTYRCTEGTCQPSGTRLIAKGISASGDQANITLPPSDSGFGAHTCAVKLDGTIVCWGANNAGQLGDGTRLTSNRAVRVNGNLSATSIATGPAHTCSLTIHGTVQCWGSNGYGQTGDGTNLTSLSPVSVQGISQAKSMLAGGAQSCAVLDDGSLQCWGMIVTEIDGFSSSAMGAQTPVTVALDVNSASVGGDVMTSTCAVHTDGTVWCWGMNYHGILGYARTTEIGSVTPIRIDEVTNALTVTVSNYAYHACAVTLGGLVQCWGYNNNGQLGNGTYTDNSAVLVQGISRATAVSAGNYHSCALVDDGSVWCWGANSYGQLGNGTTIGSNVPVPVLGLSTAVGISAGGNHTCAILATGEVECWGYNANGELGNGTLSNSSQPSIVTE